MEYNNNLLTAFANPIGGGDVQIVDKKLNFSEKSKSRINSLANAQHVPGGGNVKVCIEDIFFLLDKTEYFERH